MKVNRWTRVSASYRAVVRYGNPGYPVYELLDDHGCVAISVNGQQFKADAVRKMFVELTTSGIFAFTELIHNRVVDKRPKVDLSALEDTRALDEEPEKDE